MKILVHDLGEGEFRRQVEEAFAHFLTLDTDFPQAEYDRIAAYFTPPPFETGLPDTIYRSDPDFAIWVDQQVIAPKAQAYASANLKHGRATGRDRVGQTRSVSVVAGEVKKTKQK